MKHEPIVLIVDSKEIFDAMAAPLGRELGTRHLLHCDNLKAAMDVIQSDTRLDLIFADWELAGPGFIDAVRRDQENRYTPLIITSNKDTDTVIAMAMRQGATDHISKPFLEKGLLHVVRRVTHQQERRRHRRRHPEHDYPVDIERPSGDHLQLKLVDFSLECIQTQGQRKLCRELCIGDTSTIHLDIDDDQISLAARLVRVEENPDSSTSDDTVLLTFRLTEDHEQRTKKLAELLDELAAHTNPEQNR